MLEWTERMTWIRRSTNTYLIVVGETILSMLTWRIEEAVGSERLK